MSKVASRRATALKPTAAASDSQPVRRGGRRWTPPPSISLPGLLVDGSDREFRSFVKMHNRTAMKMLELREHFGGLVGISAPQYGILMEIAHAPDHEGVSISALADQLGVTVPFVVTEVGRMVRLGLLDKRPNPNDRRGVLVTLSAQGRTAVERLAPRLREANDLLFGALNARELAALRSMTTLLMHSADAALRMLDAAASRKEADKSPNRLAA